MDNIVQFVPVTSEMTGRGYVVKRIAEHIDAEVYTFGDIDTNKGGALPDNYNDFEASIQTAYEISPTVPELSNADLIIGHSALSPAFLSHIDTPVMVMSHGYFKELTNAFDAAIATVDNTKAFLVREQVEEMRQLAGKLLSKADILVANSNHVQEQLRKWFDLDSVIVYDPMDWQYFTPNNETGDYYLWVGRKYWLKRPELALSAFSELDEELHIVGDTGAYDGAVRDYCNRHDNLTNHGYVSKERLRDLYNGANALIHTSYDEDCPTVIREAMACNTAAIAVDNRPSREVMQGTGVLFEDNEQIVENLRNSIRSFSANNNELREKVQKYSIQNFEKQLTSAIQASHI